MGRARHRARERFAAGRTIAPSRRTPVTVTITHDEEQERERKFYAQLADEGFITLPQPSPEGIRHNPPRKIPGKPLSQIILEERR